MKETYTREEVEILLSNQFIAISKAVYVDKIPMSEFDSEDWNEKNLKTKDESPEKWAVPLTPVVKGWIKKEFVTNYYDNDIVYYWFHYPNTETLEGFKTTNHSYRRVKENYTQITEEQFIKWFIK